MFILKSLKFCVAESKTPYFREERQRHWTLGLWSGVLWSPSNSLSNPDQCPHLTLYPCFLAVVWCEESQRTQRRAGSSVIPEDKSSKIQKVQDRVLMVLSRNPSETPEPSALTLSLSQCFSPFTLAPTSPLFSRVHTNANGEGLVVLKSQGFGINQTWLQVYYLWDLDQVP